MHEVSTDGVPPGERFDFWHDVTSRTWVPYEVRCDPRLRSSFQAGITTAELGLVQVALMTTTPYTIDRTPKLIRRSDPELLKLSIAVRGRGAVRQGDRESGFAVGDLVLYDTSRPYSAALAPSDSASQLLVLRFPRSLLPLPPRDLTRLTAARIPGTDGIGALASQFLLQLGRHMDEYSPADATRLSTLALDVLTAAFAHELDAGDSLPPQTRHRALLAGIHAYIRQNLGDPDLTPGKIAAAHHISLRYLHKLFQGEGHTVVGWIRERRLEQCRRDLTDPRLATTPIWAIAGRWGFASPAHFSQAFRTAHGLTPRQFRQHHTGTTPPGITAPRP